MKPIFLPVPPDHCYTDDNCGAGHICENNRCVDACRTYHSCPYDQDCIHRRCQDPCSFFGACGINALCHTNDHKAICTCEPGYTGDPRKSCVLGEWKWRLFLLLLSSSKIMALLVMILLHFASLHLYISNDW